MKAPTGMFAKLAPLFDATINSRTPQETCDRRWLLFLPLPRSCVTKRSQSSLSVFLTSMVGTEP